MLTLALSLSLLGAEPDLGGPVIERIQEVRDSLDGNSREMKRINDRIDRWEGRILEGFDGHRLDAIGAWFSGGIQAIWKLLTGAFYLVRWLCIALVAVCVARTVHDLAYAYAAVRGKSS